MQPAKADSLSCRAYFQLLLPLSAWNASRRTAYTCQAQRAQQAGCWSLPLSSVLCDHAACTHSRHLLPPEPASLCSRRHPALCQIMLALLQSAYHAICSSLACVAASGQLPWSHPLTALLEAHPFLPPCCSLRNKISKKKEQISKAEINAQVKDDLKTVALGTSKINYLDPRITVAWCKRHEVPIEKVFNKSLLSKFFWAMDCNPEFKF